MKPMRHRKAVLSVGRQQLLIDRMTLADNEAVIVHNRSNLFYLSGYTGEGIIILTRSLCAIITDFRYTEQAEREAPDYKCYMTDKEMTRYKRAASLLSSAGVVKIWFEDDIISVKEYAALQNDLDFCLFEPIGDVIGKLREIKDLYELSCIRSACDVTSAAFEYIIT
jgi:Xaa-Pro aminopeptidase